MLDLVSVVIVCHNNWPHLELAIESALQQSYRPLEVIVVDNGSTDATPWEVPRRYGQSVRYLRQENGGDGKGRNAGFRMASGEFLQFLDGDDFLAPNKIAKQMEAFQSDPNVEVVYGETRQFQDLPESPPVGDWDVGEPADMLYYVLAEGALLVQNPLYHRRVLERVGPWDEKLYSSDIDYAIRAAWAGCRFRYSPDSLCFWRRRPNQKTADQLAMLRGLEELWMKSLGYITTEPYRSIVSDRLARCRFYRAILDPGLPFSEAVAKLRQARAVSPEGVRLTAFWIGHLLLLTPGSRTLLQARWLRPVRRPISHLFGLPAGPSPAQHFSTVARS